MKLVSAKDVPPAVAVSATHRFVVLGASNLARGFPTVVETAQRAWGRQLEMFVALGRGRSYGRATRMLGRQLPGILECGLWRELAARSALPTTAVVTDIGNDLLYHEPVERIVGWVEACLDRLVALEARTVVTLLPIENLERLSQVRFQILRRIFFPNSRIGLAEVGRRARALNEGVRRLAEARGFGIVGPRAAWYGIDPIHIRSRHMTSAWREILTAEQHSPGTNERPRTSLARAVYLHSRTPFYRYFLGFEQRRAQPSARLPGGTTISIY
jgi:hypothetical protein